MIRKFSSRAAGRLSHYYWSLLRRFQKESFYRFRPLDSVQFDYPLDSAGGHELFAGRLKPGDVVLDVGANGGLYAIVASQCVRGNGHVYACEPSERECKLR